MSCSMHHDSQLLEAGTTSVVQHAAGPSAGARSATWPLPGDVAAGLGVGLGFHAMCWKRPRPKLRWCWSLSWVGKGAT